MIYAIVLALILGDHSNDDCVPTHLGDPECWLALRLQAECLEIVGPHENWAMDFPTELRYVSRHYHHLRNAPCLADACWLPPSEVCSGCHKFTEEYREHLKRQLAARPWDARVADALLRTEQCSLVWRSACVASSTTDAWSARRAALATIMEAVGEQGWRKGDLGPWVPLLYFQQED